MPIYEYRCRDCGGEFEKLFRFSDSKSEYPECPRCKGKNTQKIISSVASINHQGKSTRFNTSSCGGVGAFR